MQLSNATQHCGIRTALFSAVLVSLFAGTAFSQVTPAAGFTPPDNTPTIKVGMTLYPNYTYQVQPNVTDSDGNSVSKSNFDVSRSYINFTGNITHAITYRITPDITRAAVTGANINNNLLFRIKYAYAQFSLDDYTGDWKGTWLRIGANQTPLVDWEEGVYRYRFQGQVFTERAGSDITGTTKLTSSDYGVSFHTNTPKNYAEIHIGIYNGEGYSSTDGNNEKAVQARVTIRPFATSSNLVSRGLRLTGFYDRDRVLVDAVKNRAVVEALFEHDHVIGGFDYMDTRDQASATGGTSGTLNTAITRGSGYGIWITPIFQKKGAGPEMLLRWDSFIPDRTNLAAKQNMLLLGASYWFPHDGNVSTAIMLDYEGTNYPGTTKPNLRKVIVHGFLQF